MSLRRRVKNIEEHATGRARRDLAFLMDPPDPDERRQREERWPPVVQAAAYFVFLSTLHHEGADRQAAAQRWRVRVDTLTAVVQRWVALHPEDAWLLEEEELLEYGLDPDAPADPASARGPLFDPRFEEQP